MSYVLQIWESPVPNSIDEIEALCRDLHQQKGEQNPKFIEFAKRLTEKYPCISTLPDDSPQAVWTDAPLNGKTEKAIYSFGVLSARLSQVRPFVVKTAKDVGLVLLDEQAGEVFLPDGRLLSVRGPESEDDPDEPAVQSRRDLKPAELPAGVPYSLHLLRPTMPSLRDAEKELKFAVERNGQESYKFKRRWFDVTTSMLNTDQQNADSLPWFSEQVLAPTLTGEVMTVQVKPDRIAKIRDQVIRTAAWQGLSVYDPQARQVFWPTGAFVAGNALYSPYKNDPAYPKRLAEKALKETMAPILEEHGFKAQGSGGILKFKRKFAGGEHVLLVLIDSGYPGCRIDCRLDMEMTPKLPRAGNALWPVNAQGEPLLLGIRIYLSRFFSAGETFASFLDYDPEGNNFNQNSIHVYTDSHAKIAGKAIARKFIARVLPMLESCTTAEGLNALVNAQLPDPAVERGNAFYEFHWRPNNLLLAHLAGDPRFDSMCDMVRARYGKVWETNSNPDQHCFPPSQFQAILEARR